MKKQLLSLKFCFLLSIVSLNSFSQWTQTNGPNGGLITAVIVKDSNIFIGTDLGIYTSSDFGNHWTPTNNGITDKRIRSLGTNDSILFAGTEAGGIFISYDNGATWNSSNNGLNSGFVFSITSSNNTLFAAAQIHDIYKSTDNGNNWILADSGLIGSTINCIASDSLTIYAATYTGVYRSTNFGISWVNSGLFSTIVWNIAISGDSIYAATDSGLYYSNNHGTSWSTIFPSMNTSRVTSNGIEILAVDFYNNIYKSSNNGQIWTADTIDFYLNYLKAFGNLFLAGTNGQGMYLSNDNGNNWIEINNGLRNTYPISLSTNGSDIFSSLLGYNGLFKTSDYGSSWNKSLNGLVPGFANSLFMQGTNIYAATSQGVYFSSDSGNTWTIRGLDSISVTSITSDSIFLIAGTGGWGTYVSIDSGFNWIQKNNGLTNLNITKVLVEGSNIFAISYGGGVFLSNDFTNLWTPINNGISPSYFFSDAIVMANRVFLATNGLGIVEFDSTTTTWNPVNNGLSSLNIYSLAGNNSILFTGTDHSVFFSTDTANSWSEVNYGLPGVTVRCLLTMNTEIYAGLYGAGVWKLPLNTLSASSIHENNSIDIFPNPFNNYVYISVKSEATITIVDVMGKIIKQNTIKHDQKIDLSELKNGVYYLYIKGPKVQEIKKVIKL